MRYIVERQSDLLDEMMGLGFIRWGYPTDVFQYWAAYRGEIIALHTVPGLGDGLSMVAVEQCVLTCGLHVAHAWANCCGDSVVESFDPRRLSGYAHRLVVAVN